MGDHETLNPGAEPIHKQHAEADNDMEFICPGEPYSLAWPLVMAHAPYDMPRVRGPSGMCPLECQVWTWAHLCRAANSGVLVTTEPHVHVQKPI